jgi:hypothetical protein
LRCEIKNRKDPYRPSRIATAKTKKNERFKNKFAVVLKYQRMIDIIYIKQ